MAIKKELILSFVAIFFITTYCGISFNNEKSYDQLKNVQCLNRKTKFMNALTKQKQGIVMIRNNVTNITNYETTIANIPIHFNVSPFPKHHNAARLHNIGVGQTVDAELALKQIYPQCKFLALDPVSDVNADLVEKKLNGTFVQRVITAEDGYSANTRPASIWNSEGWE
uniref:Rhodanese domain-containing protein n=1 Tax=Meloidogyne hapla TaxID=6305 RepID=A0A1I8BZH2_MELHA